MRREAWGRHNSVVLLEDDQPAERTDFTDRNWDKCLETFKRTANVTIQPRFKPATAFLPGRAMEKAPVESCLTLENRGEALF